MENERDKCGAMKIERARKNNWVGERVGAGYWKTLLARMAQQVSRIVRNF